MNAPLCHCNFEAKLGVSNSAKNPGRSFWSCKGVTGHKCKYFQWYVSTAQTYQTPSTMQLPSPVNNLTSYVASHKRPYESSAQPEYQEEMQQNNTFSAGSSQPPEKKAKGEELTMYLLLHRIENLEQKSQEEQEDNTLLQAVFEAVGHIQQQVKELSSLIVRDSNTK
jgi:hypothetical protein